MSTLGPRARTRRTLALLSVREREVALLVAKGLTNPQIARRLYLSLPTVKTHVARILDKLGVDNRVQVARCFTATCS